MSYKVLTDQSIIFEKIKPAFIEVMLKNDNCSKKRIQYKIFYKTIFI